MSYAKFFLTVCLSFFCLLFAKSQHGNIIISTNEPIDRLQQIGDFVLINKDNNIILANALRQIDKSGNKKDKLYFEYCLNRTRQPSPKDLPLSARLNFFKSYFSIAQELEDHFFLSILYEHIAQAYRMDNQYAQALKNYLYAADEAGKDQRGLYFKNSFLFYEMGLQFYEFADYKKSLKFGLIAHKTKYHNDPNPWENWMAKANTHMIAESYGKLNKPDSAFFWNNECIKNSQGKFTNDTLWQGIALSSIAGVYYYQAKYDDALSYYLQSISTLNSLGSFLPDHFINIFSDVAQIHLHKKQPAEAGKYLLQAKEYLPQKTFSTSALHYYKMLVAYYRYIKTNQAGLLNSIDSLDFYTKNVEKELDIKQKIKAEAGIAFEKQVAKTQLANQKYIASQQSLYGTFFILLLFIVIAVLYFKRKKLRYKLQEQQIEREKERALEALQSAQKQLDNFGRNILEKNRLIENFTEEMEKLKLSSVEKITEKEQLIETLKQSVIFTEEDWQTYNALFNKAYPRFTEKIKLQYPKITNGELRYLMFSKLNLNNKEMAGLLGISLEAIRNLKFRVKQKTGIAEVQDIVTR